MNFNCAAFSSSTLGLNIMFSIMLTPKKNVYLVFEPAPMADSYRLGLVIWRYQVRIPVGPDICQRGGAYTVFQTVQRPAVYSAVHGTVHYKAPLKSFEIRVVHSPGFGLPSIAILPWLCKKRRKAIFIFILFVSFWCDKIIY